MTPFLAEAKSVFDQVLIVPYSNRVFSGHYDSGKAAIFPGASYFGNIIDKNLGAETQLPKANDYECNVTITSCKIFAILRDE